MTLQKQLKEAIEQHQLTLTHIAKAIGISASALSQWLSDSYKGNIANIEEGVKGFLRRLKERQEVPRFLTFVETSVSRKVFEIARICHIENEVGVITGPAGVGKTWSVKEYARQNTDVILIEANLGYTARSLFVEISRVLGLSETGTIHELFEEVVNRLKDSNRLIIIDEAEHLPYRALELIRRVHDKANVGILLVGMKRLIQNLKGKKGEYEQLYSRVGIYAHLSRIDLNDVETILNTVISSANGLCRTFFDACNGNTRVLSKLIKRSIRIAQINDRAIDREVIATAAKTLII